MKGKSFLLRRGFGEYLRSVLLYEGTTNPSFGTFPNPANSAKIAGGFGRYPWSSYWAYLAKTDTLGLINTDQVLRIFSENEARARRHYEAFMNDGATVKRGDIYATIDQRVLGDERFVEGVVKKHGGDVKKERGKKEYTLPQVVHALERQYRVSLAFL